MALLTRRSLIVGSVAAAVSASRFTSAQVSLGGGRVSDTRDIDAIRLCWCPPGRFVMGSPRDEPERRPGEDQVEVALTRGFWIAKNETTQGQWKRIMGDLPGPLTAELPAGVDLPVGNVNFAEAEAFCRELTRRNHPALSQTNGNFGFRPRRNGNTHAAQAPPPRQHSETR